MTKIWVGPLAVYDCTNRHGNELERGIPLGMQYRDGSSCCFRESRSACAQGRSGSSPGFRPPCRSMSVVDPPPTHGPVMSGLPSWSLGTGPFLISKEARGVNSNEIGGRSLSLGVGAGRIKYEAVTPTTPAPTTMRAFFTETSSSPNRIKCRELQPQPKAL